MRVATGVQGGGHVGVNPFQRSPNRLRRHPELLETHAIEPLGQLAHGGVAAKLHVAKDFAYRGDWRCGGAERFGQMGAKLGERHATQVESLQHDRAKLPIEGRTRGIGVS